MKTTIIITIVSIFLFAFSCEGNKKTETTTGLEDEVTQSLEDAGLKAENFKGKIDEMLTLEMAAQVSGLPKEEAEKDHSNFSSFESIKYEWKSDRTRKIEVMKGSVMDIPLKNAIELSWVKTTTLKQFKHDYHNPTDEELKNADVAMKKKLTELEAEGKATNGQTAAASGIAKSAMSKFSVDEVPNLGDYSVFVNSGLMGVSTRDLKVFYHGLSFTLNVDLSDDKADNDKKAIKIAQMIITEKLQ
jgi:hypothetical protein